MTNFINMPNLREFIGPFKVSISVSQYNKNNL